MLRSFLELQRRAEAEWSAAAKAALTKAEKEVKVVADEAQPTELPPDATLAGNATSLFDKLLKKQ